MKLAIIYVKRWKDRTYGNSYFSCRFETTEGEVFHTSTRYGYGDATSLAFQALVDTGRAEYDRLKAPWQYFKDQGTHVVDMGYELKRDMFKS